MIANRLARASRIVSFREPGARSGQLTGAVARRAVSKVRVIARRRAGRRATKGGDRVASQGASQARTEESWCRMDTGDPGAGIARKSTIVRK